MTTPAHLSASDLRKTFNRRVIFEGISFSLESGGTLLVTGRNGSGKSTLVKILAGVLSPSRGSVRRSGDVGLVSPYLQLYDEFSAEENLRLGMALRGLPYEGPRGEELLRRVGLHTRKDDPVRAYSSGMKQRAKYAFALIHRPGILLLDEPMSNLDADGISIVRGIMAGHREAGLLVVATNDLADIDRYDERIDLNAAR
jgi:heme exporter protein A